MNGEVVEPEERGQDGGICRACKFENKKSKVSTYTLCIINNAILSHLLSQETWWLTH